MGFKLSILIPALIGRREKFNYLHKMLSEQKTDEVEILVFEDSGEKTIGEKRNELMRWAKGEYVCFVDDDDEVSSDYVSKILEAIKMNPDCCSLTGVYTVNGNNPEIFEHSLKYKEWKTTIGDYPKYERPPNHLNVIKKEIAIKYSFIPVSHGEDHDWSQRIANDQALKTESIIEGVIYHYKHITNK